MRTKLLVPLFGTILLALLSGFLLAQGPSSKGTPGIKKQPFGTQEGRPINLYTLTNSHGIEIRAMNYGGIIVSMRVPDRKGQFADIVLAYDAHDGNIPNPPYIGAVVGRYANRIANGTFTLDGKTYSLPKNDGPNRVHGGTEKTFNKVV